MKMQRNGQVLLAGAVGIGILFFAGCSSNGSTATPTQPTPSPSSGTIAFNSVVTTVTPTTETSGTTASVSVSRMNGSAGAVSVGYATTDNTAIAGTDYIAASGKLSWADGDSSVKSIPVSTAVQFSGSRSFSVDLSAPTGGAILGKNSTATVDITGLWIPPSTLSQSKKFDFTNWKLMLPIDKQGGTGGTDGTQYPAKEIQPTEIKAGYVDAYFYADASGQVIFTAPSNGAVSSPGTGTDHTRSELREIYTGLNPVSKDWTSSVGGTMTATVAIKSIAATSDVVTIGQIHGQNNTFMLLLYRKLKKDVVVDIYATNPPTNPPTHQRTPILTAVEMGDTINYSIHYIGDTITTTVEDVTTQSVSKPLVLPIDPSWAGALVYFKVGAYHSPKTNIGNPDGDQTRVSVSAISVSH